MMKKFAIIVLMALIHFGSSLLIVAVSNSVLSAQNPGLVEPMTGVRILVAVTGILHFPIISLSLYSRQWFPGNWIYVPIFFNSLIWAAGIYVLFALGKTIREKIRNGK